MWVRVTMSLPLKEGKYKCLVNYDGLGNLQESENNVFNGKDWDVFHSNCQFIEYWWASLEDYKIISDKLQSEMDSYIHHGK